ncbi:MAG TPA: redox-sensing transcriptional repressor Rex [Ruminiclostridium sp.]
MASKKISMAVIKRLPRYHRFLDYLLELGIKRVSSKELSTRMGITASQIRQDLNCFGGFGQQGYGYNVESLFSEIGNILGINKTFYAIIIGAGNMGRALANYGNFDKRGFNIIGVFDVNPEVIGKKINNMEVMSLNNLDEFILQNKVDIAVLCIPYKETASIADRVAKLGVKGLWNFSPMDLKIPYDVVVENVHLSDSLMVLGYKMNDRFER